MKTLKLTIVFLACTALIIACKKNPGEPSEPEPELFRLDSVNIDISIVKYTYSYYYYPDGKFKQMLHGNEYAYLHNNVDGTLKEIVWEVYPSHSQTLLKISYNNGLPVSGNLTIHGPADKIDPFDTYIRDSVQYQTSNGKVTQITYFDRKTINTMSGKVTKIQTDTLSSHRFGYAGNNLIKIESNVKNSATKIITYTYGTKQGIFSKTRFPFVVSEKLSGQYYSVNELLSVNSTTNTTVPSWQKQDYFYEYYKSGFPKSTVIKTVNSSGSVSTDQKLKYHYK